ncbi:hypothetical protein [Lentzea sp. CC55]|uniref:hypothetical protein n=1 Tax=Lentzea sp. CC55 TaxID=2884909 RepID=UPI001F366131|nr:hypothetical protein [Lentzea sp. CC55]MCG8924832.1 hypothetical protein [Lentzea sp. CC55]
MDEAGERHRLVHQHLVPGHQQRRGQHRAGRPVEPAGDVAQDGRLAAHAVDQAGPAGMRADDPVEVPAVEADPVVERGPRAGHDAECDSGGRGVDAEDVGQYLVGVPAAAGGVTEVRQRRHREKLLVRAAQCGRVHGYVLRPKAADVQPMVAH